MIDRTMILSNDTTLRVPPLTGTSHKVSENKTMAEVEKQYIVEVLEETGWRVRGKDGAAEILDIKPTTLESRMHKLNILRPTKKHDKSQSLRYIGDF